MPQALTKITVSTLLGIVFFLGGAGTASALAPDTGSLTPIVNNAANATTQAPTNQAQTDAKDAQNTGDRLIKMKELACNPFPSASAASWAIGDGTFAGCVSQTVYYLFYIPLSWVMIAGAFVFDAMLTLSIDTKFISQDFINTTWTVVRDFSNMLFIFILLYTGVQTILGIGDWKKTVFYVVIMALLINFSLFFTKVVIDAGNILSVGVYQAIAPEKTGLNKNLADRPGGLTERNVSFALTRGFQPQSFIGKTATTVEPLDAAIIFIVAGVVSAFAGYIFFKAGILFSRRLVVFWGLMILSPFAFISMALPGDANKFHKWLGELIKQTFVAPVFLFFIYIIMQVVNSGVLKNLVSPQSDGSITMFTFDKILLPVIAASLIIKALQEALKYAEDMAGSTGAEFSGLVAGAMGMATGGASLAAQKTLGRGALALAGSDKFKSIAAKSPIGRVAYSLTDKAANSTFDVRNAPGGSSLGIGKGGEGSFKKTVEETKKADVEFGKKIMYDKDGKLIPGAAGDYTAQLKKGYATRRGTGGNVGASEAAEETKKTVEKEEKKEAQKTRRSAELEAKKLDLQKKYGELLTDAQAHAQANPANPDLYEDAHNTASAELKASEKAVDMAEEGTDVNAQATAKVRYAQALAKKKTAEKELNMYNTGNTELAKIHKEIEDLNA